MSGGSLILWSPGKREIIAAYGAGGWISLTTGKFAKRNRVEKPKTNPKP